MENSLVSLYKERCKYNDVESIILLGSYYLENKEDDKAFDVLRKFEDIENKDGYRKLAYLYQNGRGVKQDLDKAMFYYKKAYDLNDISSGYNLALLLIKEGKYSEAIPYLVNGRFNNHLPSIKVLADLYRQGLGVDKNDDIAINLYKELVALGEQSLYDEIGVIYYQNHNYLEAIQYFEKGANILDKNSLYHLGICFSKGQGVYLDMQKAIYYYELAVTQGDYRSLYNLSLIYDKGIGVSVDKDKAQKLMEKYKIMKKQ